MMVMIFVSAVAAASEYRSPKVGGGGGNRNYNLDCGANALMVGINGKSGSWLNAIGIVCRKINARGGLGDTFTRGPRGGSGGKAKESLCRPGEAVRKVQIAAGTYVHGITFHCAKWNPNTKRLDKPLRYNHFGAGCFTFGCSSQGPFTCPNGKVAKAFRGRYGSYVDNTRYVCDDWNK